jgi:hypothetical protein
MHHPKSAIGIALSELEGTKCFCGRSKKSGQSFCSKDYFKLPPRLRTKLYVGINDGYLEAYGDAKDYLKENL